MVQRVQIHQKSTVCGSTNRMRFKWAVYRKSALRYINGKSRSVWRFDCGLKVRLTGRVWSSKRAHRTYWITRNRQKRFVCQVFVHINYGENVTFNLDTLPESQKSRLGRVSMQRFFGSIKADTFDQQNQLWLDCRGCWWIFLSLKKHCTAWESRLYKLLTH